jgi:hypothetical protein
VTFVTKRLITLGVMVAVGGGAAAVVLWQKGRSERRVTEEESGRKLLALDDASAVRKLALKSTHGSFELSRPDGGDTWRVTKPLDVAADDSTVGALVDYLVELRRSRYVGAKEGGEAPPPPEDLTPFGLEPPRLSVTVTDAAGVTEVVYVGHKASFDGSLYVTTGSDPRVAMVAGALEYQLDKKLYDLREKRLAIFETGAVERLDIDRGDEVVAVERRGDEYDVVEPRQVEADRAQIKGILTALAELRASRFVSEAATAAELAEHGLSEPRARVTLTIEGGGEPLVLLFGETGPAEDVTHLAGRGAGQPLVELSSDWVIRKLMTGVDELRDKHVLRFERSAVRTISIAKKGEEPRVFENTREKERDTWKMVQPAAQDAIDSVLTGLLYRLWSLKARRIEVEQAGEAKLAELGLAQPAFEITLTDADGADLGILRFAPQNQGEVRVNVKGRGRVDVIDAAFVRELSTSPDDYIETEAEDD